MRFTSDGVKLKAGPDALIPLQMLRRPTTARLEARSWQLEAELKTLLRTLLYFALIVWLGAEIFFPVVAAITFTTLSPDTHTAGSIVGELLRILHGMGLVSGMVALALFALAPA